MPVAARRARSSSVLAIPGIVATPPPDAARCGRRVGRRAGHPGHVPADRQRRRRPTAPASPACARSGRSGWPRCRRRAGCSAGSVVWSRSQDAISTACWWCTVMSCANPTSTESAAGTAGVRRAGQPEQQAAGRPEQQQAERDPGRDEDPDPAGPVREAGRARRPVGLGGRRRCTGRHHCPSGVTPVLRRGLRHRAGRAGRRRRGERRRVVLGEVRRAQLVAARPGLRVGVLVQPQRGDELVDPRVVGVGQLELVPPRLQRDRLVEARVGRHQRVGLVLDLLPQPLERVAGDLVRVVGDPDRAVLQRVHHVLVAHRLRVDDAVAGRPDVVVGAAERRAVRVGDLLVGPDVLAALVGHHLHARDLRRRVLVLAPSA